ncbi:MAG: VTT domain-containing protein, partial [Gammaproteobacteria bacterium]|nr:VTT domain-containing protein [Gammaproteobacteria bacterium]
MQRSRWLLIAAIVLAIVVFLAFDPGRFLNLAYLKAQQSSLQNYVAAYPLQASGLCFLIYAVATAVSIPGAFVMTLAAGAVFGVLWGTLIVSFASTFGATIAFLMARYLFRGFVQARFGHRLVALNRGIARDGPFYLLTLRLIPIVSFIAINLLMALTPISMRNFYI